MAIFPVNIDIFLSIVILKKMYLFLTDLKSNIEYEIGWDGNKFDQTLS